MAYIPDYVKKLIHKYNKRPVPFNYDELDNFQQYKEYLEKELNKE